VTEPLSEISRVKETGRNGSRSGNPRHEKLKRQPDDAEDDCVDISEEARSRASGKRRGNILEYIEGQGG